MDIPTDRLKELLRLMYAIRAFECKARELYEQSRIAGEFLGALHSYEGEEAVAAGVCSALRQDDYVLSFGFGEKAATLRCGEVSKGVPVACKEARAGYSLEIAIPWNRFGFQPVKGKAMGFDVALTDVDDAARHAELVFAGASYDRGDPTGFGHLVLGD